MVNLVRATPVWKNRGLVTALHIISSTVRIFNISHNNYYYHSPDNNGVNVEEGPGLGCMLVFSPIILGGKVLRALSEGPLPAQDQSHLSDRQMEHHSEVRHKLEQQPYHQFKCLPQS